MDEIINKLDTKPDAGINELNASISQIGRDVSSNKNAIQVLEDRYTENDNENLLGFVKSVFQRLGSHVLQWILMRLHEKFRNIWNDVFPQQACAKLTTSKSGVVGPHLFIRTNSTAPVDPVNNRFHPSEFRSRNSGFSNFAVR
ncbi:hypothetical protein JTB14_006749 [Gonioctena quinquepunctata]|nr:hypothetical protein JTB14_006749 [Gonioctena quinquepunctata]